MIAEYRHLKQWLEMRYKLSFLVFKIRPVWGIFDFLANYFYLILAIVVLCYALYHQIAVVWGIMLIWFMLQTLFSSKQYYKFRQKQHELFETHKEATELTERLD